MLYPSVWSGYYHALPIEQCIQKLCEAGFSHTELCIDHVLALLEQGSPEQVGARLAEFASGLGFSIPQGHLSFEKDLCTAEAVERLKRELEFFGAIGIRNAVLHLNGGNDLPPEARMAKRMESVGALVDFVKGSSVTLCLENLPSISQTHTAQQLNKIIDELGGAHLGICLDTGHLHLVRGRGETTQTQEEFIAGAGKRLKALHITNNNGQMDVHQMPYSGRYGIDWAEVVRALKSVGYDGLFNLEILGECEAPEPIKQAKLAYIKAMTDYMLSQEHSRLV